MAIIARFIIGVVLLLLGRRLFWFFVGAVGFVMGLSLAGQFFPEQSSTVQLLIGLVFGLAGAALAVFLQGIAVWLGGFLAGGYLAQAAVQSTGLELSGLGWLVFLLGGILGALLVGLLFDWALIILSALLGASLIMHSFPIHEPARTAALVALAASGIALQAFTRRGAAPRPARPPQDGG